MIFRALSHPASSSVLDMTVTPCHISSNNSTPVSLFKLAVHWEGAMILPSKEQEFRSLFSEFVKDYLKTSDGENHLNSTTKVD